MTRLRDQRATMQRRSRRLTVRVSPILGLMAGAALLVSAPAAAPAAAEAPPLASEWTLGHKSRTRLTAARLSTSQDGPAQLYGFVEIALADGWKTYWKNPGDSGIPPRFDFAGSDNLASSNVLYPAPHRIDDKGDTIIGYTGTVLFPVVLTATDPKAPMTVTALVQFGMCKDICVPTEAALSLTIPPGEAGLAAAAESDAIARVPRTGTNLAPSDPRLTGAPEGVAAGATRLSLTADFPGGADGADAFLDVPDGLYLPLLKKTKEDGTRVTFEADLSKDVDRAALSGKTIAVTLVSKSGTSETSFKFE